MTEQEFDIFASSVRNKLLAIAWHTKAGSGLDVEPEDIVQEALLTLWRLIHDGYPVRDANAIAVKITKNLIAASARRQQTDTIPVSDIDMDGGPSATEITASRSAVLTGHSLSENQLPAMTLSHRRRKAK